jgi:hypothetical protein
MLTATIAIAAIALSVTATFATCLSRLGCFFGFFLFFRAAREPAHQAFEEARRRFGFCGIRFFG